MPGLHSIDFGLANASEERESNPDLLLGGFWDSTGWRNKLEADRHFLVLGAKGSGKTALLEHLRLTAERSQDSIVTALNLRQLPFVQFRSITNQAGDALTRIPDAWMWFLSLLVYEMVSLDDRLDTSRDFLEARANLQKGGVLPSANVPALVRNASKSSIRLSLAPVIGYQLDSSELSVDIGPSFGPFVRQFFQTLLQVRPSVPMYLFLDGFDEVDLRDPGQMQVLGGLLQVADEMNREFRGAGLSLKIVVLCRPDVFERLGGSNKNKLRQDQAIELTWYQQIATPKDAHLVKMADQKARVADPDITSVMGDFFPAMYHGRPIERYLLDRTRLVPRDYLQLLRRIQTATPAGSNVTEDSIRDGIREYSTSYFKGEIIDSMEGFVAPDAIEYGFGVLGSVRRVEFTIEELEDSPLVKVDRYGEIESFLEGLFNAGGLGLSEGRKDSADSTTTFKYRSPARLLDVSSRLRIHPGLWASLNLREPKPKSKRPTHSRRTSSKGNRKPRP